MERWLAKLLRETLVITHAGGPAKHDKGRSNQASWIQRLCHSRTRSTLQHWEPPHLPMCLPNR